MSRREPTPRRVAENLISHYGIQNFRRLVELFSEGYPGRVIATEFKVSRQRTNQWKNALGDVRVMFVLNPEVEELLGLLPSRRTSI